MMTDLSVTMGIDHHATLPYCPWANGSVEVVGKDGVGRLEVQPSEAVENLGPKVLLSLLNQFNF